MMQSQSRWYETALFLMQFRTSAAEPAATDGSGHLQSMGFGRAAWLRGRTRCQPAGLGYCVGSSPGGGVV